jgi:hypothetical protein
MLDTNTASLKDHSLVPELPLAWTMLSFLTHVYPPSISFNAFKINLLEIFSSLNVAALLIQFANGSIGSLTRAEFISSWLPITRGSDRETTARLEKYQLSIGASGKAEIWLRNRMGMLSRQTTRPTDTKFQGYDPGLEQSRVRLTRIYRGL